MKCLKFLNFIDVVVVVVKRVTSFLTFTFSILNLNAFLSSLHPLSFYHVHERRRRVQSLVEFSMQFVCGSISLSCSFSIQNKLFSIYFNSLVVVFFFSFWFYEKLVEHQRLLLELLMLSKYFMILNCESLQFNSFGWTLHIKSRFIHYYGTLIRSDPMVHYFCAYHLPIAQLLCITDWFEW